MSEKTKTASAYATDVVIAKADELRAKLKRDRENGRAVDETFDEFYFKHAAARNPNLTPETSKDWSAHDTEMNAVVHLAVGEFGVAEFKKDKTLNELTGEFPLGHHATLEVSIERHRQFTNHMSENKETVDRYGYMPAFKLTTKASAGGASLKRIKSYVSDEALSLLK